MTHYTETMIVMTWLHTLSLHRALYILYFSLPFMYIKNFLNITNMINYFYLIHLVKI